MRANRKESARENQRLSLARGAPAAPPPPSATDPTAMSGASSRRAAMTQKFPLDKDRVESYFAQPTVKAKAKVEGGVVVE